MEVGSTGRRFPAVRVGIVAGAAAAVAVTLAVLEATAAGPTLVTVTAGVPREFAFRLSPRSPIPAGPVTFRVENRGEKPHSFRLCGKTVAGPAPNACVGAVTRTIPPGGSASLRASLAGGTYAFLSAVPGDAARGMKGLLRVAPAPGTVGPGSPGAPPSAPPETLQGNPTSGAAVFAANACGSCHTLAAAGAHGVDCPNLDLTKPSQATVRSRVTLGAYGGGGVVMPSFNLTAGELNDLAAFVYVSTHTP